MTSIFNLILFNNIFLVVLFTSWGSILEAAPHTPPQKKSLVQLSRQEIRTKQKVVVAVIDTGADIHHPWIRNHLWNNPGESGVDATGRLRSTNGLDDDGNGFIDDVHGWNFLDNNNNLRDEIGHGTHISGLISGEALGSSTADEVSQAVQIMVLKYYSNSASPDSVLDASARSIEYATRMGAHILNYSGGGATKHLSEYLALLRADFLGRILIAAAGNEEWNLDKKSFFPASYPLKNALRVAALRDRNNLIEKSNFGASTVDLAAPGFNILSAAPGNSSSVMSGTSQATALVSALIARYWSARPRMTGSDVRENFLRGLEKSAGMKNKVRGEKVALRQIL